MRTAALQSGLREDKPEARREAWEEPVATGRCEVCARLAYHRAKLCRICTAQLAYDAQVRALGYPRRQAETAESRALHRWLSRQERRAVARGARDWLLAFGLTWALGYIVARFAVMFAGWLLR